MKVTTRKDIFPSEWKLEYCSEIFELKHGHQFLEGDFVSNDGLKVLKIGQMLKNGELDLDNCDFISFQRKEEFKDYIIRKGDVLMALTGATLGKTVIVKEDIKNVYQNYRVGNFLPKNGKILKDFLYFVLSSKSIQNQIFNLINAHAQPNIGKADFEKVKILLPPLKEQQKIASILSNVDLLIQKTDRIIEHTKILKKGLMQRLLTKGIGHTKFKKTELGDIPEEWNVLSLHTISTKIVDIDHNMPKKTESGIPFISVGYLVNRQSYYLDIDEKDSLLEYISEEDYSHHSKRFDAENNDLLYSRFGTIGVAKIINSKLRFIASYSVVLIKPKKENIFPLFLNFALNSDYSRKQAQIMTQGSSNRNLHLSDIRNLRFFIPPLKEQQKIASILSNVDLLIQKEQINKTNIENLKKGLMQQLLTGKIRVKV